MPCTESSSPTPPTLPSPFSVEPPANTLPPPPAEGVRMCCTKPLPALPPLPLPPLPPGVMNPAFLSALNQAEATIEAFADQFASLIPCPRE